jgi:hypothetical protein
MTLRYDSVGYAKSNGHWIHKPLVAGDRYCVFEGSHPHDPDGDSYLLEVFNSESAAIDYAKGRYVEWLKKELKRLA